MSDLIDRQALMKEFSDFVRASNNSDFARTPTWNDAVSLVGSMPSAQPERKTGVCITLNNNNRTVTIKLARREVCELLLACDAMSADGAKWITIRDKMREQLDAFDVKSKR